MTKFTKTTRTLAALLVSGTALTGVASAAEISGNVGATTDYIWRGNTQASGDASLSGGCLLYTSPSPRDRTRSRMPSSA